MDVDTTTFLSSVRPLSLLPAAVLDRISGYLTTEKLPKGTLLAIQGKTKLSSFYILKEGFLEAYFEDKGKKVRTLSLSPGDTYGGISILMNNAVSIRSVLVREDASIFLLPVDRFREICNGHQPIYRFFVDTFARRMADEAYAARAGEGRALTFLAGTAPFAFLPEEAIEQAATHLSMVFHPNDTILFYQGRSPVEHLYIVQKGAAERYFEENGQRTMFALLGEGDIFGGISLLVNDGRAVRSMRTVEDSTFFTLPAGIFLELCERYDLFADYFTNILGKRMLDRSYAAIIAGSLRPEEEKRHFFDQSVSNMLTPKLIWCESETSIRQAAAEMSRHHCSSILVKNAAGGYAGLVTDHDLREKVISAGHDTGRPVSEIMSSPLKTISSRSLIFEALMTLMHVNVKHLAVVNGDGKVEGMITNRDLINAQTQSPLFLIREIQSVEDPGDLKDKSSQQARLIQGLMHSGAKAGNITRLITMISDAVLERVIGFVLQDMPPPPARFAFMVMGSEGRREQTLGTDQDNAVIFEDISDKRDFSRAMEYFLTFGERVCDLLDQAGYHFCKGGVMAKNPKWCQPVSAWKHYFTSWIHTAEAKDLRDASIFFDFRTGYGDIALVKDLRDYLFDALTGWSGFFRHLMENALHFKPPLGFFRNFVVESKGEHRDSLDLKAAMMPIVDIVRIYALKHRIEATNTMERLERLRQDGVLSKETCNELDLAYGFLMQMRFSRQMSAVIWEHGDPENYINPKKLSPVERTMLKEIFKLIEKYQTRTSFDFTGSP
jgi:CBS domain-containing protein